MGFDGRGWFWEWPLVWLGLIKLKLFTIILRTLTREPRPYPKSNLSWIRPWTWLPFSPWSCVRLILGGAVNKVGLWNPGIDYWCEEIAPKMDFEKNAFIASSIMEFGDLAKVWALGAKAVSFGTIHLPDYPFWRWPWTLFTNPCKPTTIVTRALKEAEESKVVKPMAC